MDPRVRGLSPELARRLFAYDGTSLEDGIQLANLWAKVEPTNFVQSRIRDRKLEVIADGGIEGLPNDRAVELVRKTFDPALLRAWRDPAQADGRKTVVDAIEGQLAKLDGSKPG